MELPTNAPGHRSRRMGHMDHEGRDDRRGANRSCFQLGRSHASCQSKNSPHALQKYLPGAGLFGISLNFVVAVAM